MSSYEGETLRLIDAIPKEDNECFGCHVSVMRRGDKGSETQEMLEEVALWESTARALQSGEDKIGTVPDNWAPIRQRMAANCLLKRALGACKTVYIPEEA